MTLSEAQPPKGRRTTAKPKREANLAEPLVSKRPKAAVEAKGPHWLGFLMMVVEVELERCRRDPASWGLLMVVMAW